MTWGGSVLEILLQPPHIEGIKLWIFPLLSYDP